MHGLNFKINNNFFKIFKICKIRVHEAFGVLAFLGDLLIFAQVIITELSQVNIHSSSD